TQPARLDPPRCRGQPGTPHHPRPPPQPHRLDHLIRDQAHRCPHGPHRDPAHRPVHLGLADTRDGSPLDPTPAPPQPPPGTSSLPDEPPLLSSLLGRRSGTNSRHTWLHRVSRQWTAHTPTKALGGR